MQDQPRVPSHKAELDRIRAELTGELGARVVAVEGDAGIGKTTLLDELVENGDGAFRHVLVTRPAEGERRLAFGGLSDLLSRVPRAAFEALPRPQARALDVAVGRVEPPEGGIDHLVLSLATLALLRTLANDGPVLVAIDDLQWLDRSSLSILTFAVRRLEAEPIAVVFSVRRSRGSGTLIGQLTKDRPGMRVSLGPVSVEELSGIIHARLAGRFPRPLVRRIHEATAGNPFYAWHLASAIAAAGGPPPAGRPLPAPDSLQDLVRARIASLGDAAIEVVVVAAALARPTRSLIEAAIGDPIRGAAGLDEAERLEILKVRDDACGFSHPLLASVAYEGLTDGARRTLHRRLADTSVNREERALHLALAAPGPDLAVAVELGAVADDARHRAAVATAAELYETAMRMTPAAEVDQRANLGRQAADCHLTSGDAVRARELLRELAASVPRGPVNHQVTTHLGHVLCSMGDDRVAIGTFEGVLAEPDLDPRLACEIHIELAWMTTWVGETPLAIHHIRRARDLAEGLGDPRLLAGALDKYAQIEFQLGQPDALTVARRAAELEAKAGIELGEAALNETMLMVWADQLAPARRSLERMLKRAIDLGDEFGRADILVRLSNLEYRAGRWPVAARLAEDALAVGRAGGISTSGAERALAVAAVGLGNFDAARVLADSLLPEATTASYLWIILHVLATRGWAEVSADDHATAAATLRGALELKARIGIEDPGIERLESDAIDACVGIGDLDTAEAVVGRLEAQAERTGRLWGRVAAGRGRAQVESARGHHDAAIAAIEGSLTIVPDLGQAFERGRTLLVAGIVHRRGNRRREARAALTQAIAVFEEVGAVAWIGRAQAELGRISGRATSPSGMTETERQVAEAVASGLSNREVAARLFMTVRTVETNLSRVYEKLGVRSRTQLALQLTERDAGVASRPG